MLQNNHLPPLVCACSLPSALYRCLPAGGDLGFPDSTLVSPALRQQLTAIGARVLVAVRVVQVAVCRRRPAAEVVCVPRRWRRGRLPPRAPVGVLAAVGRRPGRPAARRPAVGGLRPRGGARAVVGVGRPVVVAAPVAVPARWPVPDAHK